MVDGKWGGVSIVSKRKADESVVDGVGGSRPSRREAVRGGRLAESRWFWLSSGPTLWTAKSPICTQPGRGDFRTALHPSNNPRLHHRAGRPSTCSASPPQPDQRLAHRRGRHPLRSRQRRHVRVDPLVHQAPPAASTRPHLLVLRLHRWHWLQLLLADRRPRLRATDLRYRDLDLVLRP